MDLGAYSQINSLEEIMRKNNISNWPTYRAEVETQPWFIEKVDDPFDSTYCDIYAKIGD